MKITEQTHQRRDGGEFGIYRTDAPDPNYPIHGWMGRSGTVDVATWRADGGYRGEPCNHPYDLIPRIQSGVVWVVVYRDRSALDAPSRQAAIQIAEAAKAKGIYLAGPICVRWEEGQEDAE